MQLRLHFAYPSITQNVRQIHKKANDKQQNDQAADNVQDHHLIHNLRSSYRATRALTYF
jgi:hypothetical protein